MLDWLQTCCGCCPCYEKQEPEFAYATEEFSDIEDGDMLQEAGVQRTLELLRQMMNQSTSASADHRPPPNYQDFDKYPLSVENHSKAPPFPLECFADPNRGGNISSSGGSLDAAASQTSIWNEPFPKPSGQPPPVPVGWLQQRMAALRRSLVNRFSLRQQHQSEENAIVEIVVNHNQESAGGSDSTVGPNVSENARAVVEAVDNRLASEQEQTHPVVITVQPVLSQTADRLDSLSLATGNGQVAAEQAAELPRVIHLSNTDTMDVAVSWIRDTIAADANPNAPPFIIH